MGLENLMSETRKCYYLLPYLKQDIFTPFTLLRQSMPPYYSGNAFHSWSARNIVFHNFWCINLVLILFKVRWGCSGSSCFKVCLHTRLLHTLKLHKNCWHVHFCFKTHIYMYIEAVLENTLWGCFFKWRYINYMCRTSHVVGKIWGKNAIHGLHSRQD